MDVYVELAKLYEHQKKDYDLALEMTQQSLLYLEELGEILKPSKIIQLRQELQRRNENNSQAKYFPGKRRIEQKTRWKASNCSNIRHQYAIIRVANVDGRKIIYGIKTKGFRYSRKRI